MSNRRLTARDYKGVRRDGFDLGRWRELGIGFGAGLLVALIVYVGDHRGGQRGADGARALAPTPRHGAAPGAGATVEPLDAARAGTGAGATTDVPAAAGEKYDFYDGLPKFEVLVPEKEHATRVDAAARVSRPGTYFLQAGSYRNVDEANRVQAQLARQKISANVQRVALDADVWYRIRIGPVS
ncbi:MAG: SPOR domain-containing protein, partial [Gammaproteobacteria bacterium]|nr:SPOR domain-containing protein [Gammaproteobacteria bacterium]